MAGLPRPVPRSVHAVAAAAVVCLGAGRAQSTKLDALLERHAFFSKIDYTKVDAHAPFVFYVQRPPKDRAGYADRVTKRYLPYLRELERIFVAEYAEPLGLTRRADAAYAIAILASAGSYKNYANAVRDPGLHIFRAHFDPALDLAVTYEDPFASQSNREKRNALLHEFVHALQYAYYSGPGPMPKPIWFNEGLADYRSSARNLISSLKNPDLVANHVRMVAALTAVPNRQPLLSSLRELVDADGPGYAKIVFNARKRAGVDAVDEAYADLAVGAFYAQSSLLAHFLHTAGGGRYRPGFLRYAKDVMAGKSGFATFESAYADVGMSTLEAAFAAFVDAEVGRRFPGLARGDGASPAAGAVGGAVGAAQANALAPAPPFDPIRLSPKANDWRAHLGAVLYHAARGELALAQLLASSLTAPDGEPAERAERERERVERLVGFRSEFLGAMQSGRKLVQIEGGGTKRRGRIESFDDETIRLVFGRVVHEVPIGDLTPEILYREANKRDLFEGDSAWIGGYLLLLADEPESKQDRHLRGSGEAPALRRDRADYPALRAQGAAASALLQLAGLEQPEDRDGAALALAGLRSVLAEFGSHPLMRARRADLEAFARFLLDRVFDASSPDSLGLHGAVEGLGEGRLRVAYDFADAAQGADFSPADDPLEDARSGLDAIKAARQSGFRVEDGALEGVGAAFHRFAIPLQAPSAIDFSITFKGEAVFRVGICGNGFGDGIAGDVIGGLAVSDAESGIGDYVDSKLRTAYVGRTYRHRIEHDGNGKVVSRINGAVVATADRIGKLERGWITLWIHSNHPIRIDDLTIEGTIDETRTGAVRSAWIEREVEAMFGK